jgi:ferric-dicitrate binding protein FerR (iron transport regulator)
VKPQVENNGLKAVDQQSKRFFARGEFNWEKSKADVWNELEAGLKPAGRVVSMNVSIVKWAIAAVFVMLVGIVSLMRFSSETIETVDGQHLAITLPDGSTVNLNAQSTITYHPYWWRFDRKIEFEGEALFSVEKGKRFRVISNVAKTEVLGTRFNIFARENTYKVTCVEGSVKVVTTKGEKVILKPNDKATVQTGGTIIIQNNIETLPEISWKDFSFFFTSVPLSDVFSEIERQYGVRIDARVDVHALYTGNFSKNQNIEEILGYICPAMGFKFIRQSATTFSVIPDPQ